MKASKVFAQRCSQKISRHLAAAALALLMMSGLAWADPGDQWILPVDVSHLQGSGWVITPYDGYNGTPSYEGIGTSGSSLRISWVLNGLSVSTSNAFPTSTELYSIEFFCPYSGEPANNWQPIESQFEGAAGEIWPIDPNIPWAGAYGQNHQWIGAENGTPGTWTPTGPGPQCPNGPDYNACGACTNSFYMWLTRGSWVYAKWDFAFFIDHTWSALRLTEVTGFFLVPNILSVNHTGGSVTLTWSSISNRMYQVEYRTNIDQPDWGNLGSPITATNTTATASDTIGANAQRFYRVALLP